MKGLHLDFSRNVHCILGLPFDALTLEQAVTKIRDAAFNRTPCFFSTPNLNFLITARSNEQFRQSVLKSDLSLADGMPIVWLAKFLSVPITERVAGSDVFDALRKCSGRKVKVYFFGGMPGVAQRANELLNAEDGGLECVGYETPGFGSVAEMSTTATIEKINASGAEFLVVSLGAVKGQAWIERNLSSLNVPVVSHLGAVLNFVAGSIHRAPRWMQVAGLEWLWRIVQEPTLWKRYTVDGLLLLRLLASQLTMKNIGQILSKGNFEFTEPIEIQHEASNEHLQINIRGCCIEQNLTNLRELLQHFSDRTVNISIDLKSASKMDPAFWGLLSILSGQQLNRSKWLKIDGQLFSGCGGP